MQIPHYSSESDSVDTDSTKQSRQRLTKSWKWISTFKSTLEADNFVKNEETWSKFYKNNNEEGIKQYYRCNKTKYRGKQCSASMFLLYESTCSTIKMFKNEQEHDHEKTNNLCTIGINDITKEIIKSCFEDRRKPKYIMEYLATKKISLPSMSQLKNYLTLLRKQKFGSPQISIGELERFLLENSTIPDIEDVPFIVAYEINDVDEIDFRFFISTKRLLTHVASSKIIHADATYKLTWQGFPILIVGTTDRDRKFHHFGIVVTTNEKTQDFAFMFKTLKDWVKKDGADLQPELLIADASQAIRNGFHRVFGTQSISIMCWAHMRKNVTKKVEKYCHKNLVPEIFTDLDQLQLSNSEHIFLKASNLFIDKWSHQDAFIKYFKEEWLEKNQNWYEGAAKSAPSTNNALEASNRVIKDEHTLRERIPLNQFKILAMEMIQKWSLAYAYKLKAISKCPTITLETWIAAYNWVKENKNGTCQEDEMFTYYKVPSGKNASLSNILDTEEWLTFEDFKMNAFSNWTIQLPKNCVEENWIYYGTCNCPKFMKKMQCKHLVGMAIRLKYVKPPIEAKSTTIGLKKKRGRPKKIGKAYIFD